MRLSLSIIAVLGLFVCFGVVSCDTTPTGDFVQNEPPSTFLTVSRINREGDFRLSSQINISWWGTDSDGYITGYEFAIDDTTEGAWRFTSRTDSTFILPIEMGETEGNVLFKVRAVDNDGAVDSIGARLVFPIVNTPPTVELNITEQPPDTLFRYSSFGWTINDIDGISNVLRTEIALNDTNSNWVEMPIPDGEDRVFITLGVDNETVGEKSADVFIGRSLSSADGLSVPGLRVGELNTFYVRAIDFAGAVSNIDTVSWFVKPKTSNILFLNDVAGSNAQTLARFHLNMLSEMGLQPDVWFLNDDNVLSEAFPRVIDPTLVETLAQWDHIYWVSSGVSRNISFALEITDLFFERGGNMFVNVPIRGVSNTNQIFNFLPIDSLGVFEQPDTGPPIPVTGFLINRNSEVVPVNGFNGPVLRVSQRITGVSPLVPVPGATVYYEADIQAARADGFNEDYTG
ncbi:MAG: hypothetical protein AAFW89_13045, partial [Bacteroidota bacterium]